MTHQPWNAEWDAPPDLVGELIESLMPELAGRPFALAGRGWDVDVWRVDDVALRIPRRELGEHCVENEITLLPFVASRLPVAVPEPIAVGRPSPRFRHCYFAHAWLPGQTADALRLGTSARVELARPLGRLLRSLHAIGPRLALEAGAKSDQLRRDLGAVSRRALSRAESLSVRSDVDRQMAHEARARLSALPAANFEPDIFIHADLYARHLVLYDSRALSAVIDWGDVCLGDRAVDLDIVFAFLPPGARPAFWEEYGPVSPATIERARFFALARHAVTLLDYALDVGDEALGEEARFALGNALE